MNLHISHLIPKVLVNRIFARLYLAQSISLLGDSLTWVALALTSYEISPKNSGAILSTVLTIRVVAFILFAPIAGTFADRFNRKQILYISHFSRMILVGSLPFAHSEWHIFFVVFLLNMFNAFFTPAYRAVIPAVTTKKDYRQAVGLSAATYQILGILGPGIAGFFALWFGPRDIFFIDAISFIAAALLILSVPSRALYQNNSYDSSTIHHPHQTTNPWQDVFKGMKLLFSKKAINYAIFIEFISSVAGSQILVNSIGLIKNTMQLKDDSYGLIMGVFAAGAAIAALISGVIDKSKTRKYSLLLGGLLISIAVIPANYADFTLLLPLWLIAGLGQSLANIPSETLIGELIPSGDQGKVYGAHYAISHLWWAIGYPIAGYLGSKHSDYNFLLAGITALILTISGSLLFYKKQTTKRPISHH